MADALPIDVRCRYCGEPLAVVRELPSLIAGIRSLQYVHAANGSPTCTNTYPAKPYDAWDATRAYERALRAAGHTPTQGGEDAHED